VHKFKIGDTVFLEGSLNVPSGAYVIIRQLPERNGECEYQIKNAPSRTTGLFARAS
jgi:hypothetical protein